MFLLQYLLFDLLQEYQKLQREVEELRALLAEKESKLFIFVQWHKVIQYTVITLQTTPP